MSTPAKDGTEVGARQSGMSKMVSRMRRVLKRRDGSKRFSFFGRSAASPAAAEPSAPEAAVSASAAQDSTPNNAPEPEREPTPAPASASAPVLTEPTTTTTTTTPEPIKIMRSQVEAERAQRIRERFKLDIEPKEWMSSPDREIYRIEKPIRMRIHRTCHRCGTSFSGTRACALCSHNKCSKCPRIPAKKDAEKKDKQKGMSDDYFKIMREEMILTRPSNRPGGQALVRKKPVQRVRRTCHRCSTLFQSGSRECASCGHHRCQDCPRDPAKKNRYPDGYPGDEFSSTSTGPIRYCCHRCMKAYPPLPQDMTEMPECIRCGHPKCEQCPRAKPMKVEPEPDPDVMRSLEAKLEALRFFAVEGEST